MAILKDFKDFDVQVLNDTINGVFAGKTAFMGSLLRQAGAVVVSDQLPGGGEDFIGNEVTVPYFGTIGRFVNNPEDQAVTPRVLKATNEKATVARSSLSFEVSTWGRNSVPGVDPYKEASRQTMEAAERRMDELMIGSASTTPLVRDVWSAGGTATLDWDVIVDGRQKWGDDQSDIVGLAVHSRTEADLRKLRDGNGNLLLVQNFQQAEVPRFCGIPLVVSDMLDTTGSIMTAVTEAGASVGGVTLTGTPNNTTDLKIDIVLGGARGTAAFRFSTDGGNTWSATLLTAATVVLTDTAADSQVGMNGETGITANFGVATYDANSVYSSKSVLKTTSLIIQRGALAFYYSRKHIALQTDKDILKDNDVAAMHIYHASHRYRRRPRGTKTGVVAIKHNVGGF